MMTEKEINRITENVSSKIQELIAKRTVLNKEDDLVNEPLSRYKLNTKIENLSHTLDIWLMGINNEIPEEFNKIIYDKDKSKRFKLYQELKKEFEGENL